MPAALDEILRRSTFFYRCRGIELVGATPYLLDSGPHGLHAAMVNFVAPNYGLVTMPSGRPGVVFNGTTQYATLPLRFYDHAPTDQMTMVMSAYHRDPAAADRFFSSATPASTRGLILLLADANRPILRLYDAAATISMQTYPTAGIGLAGQTKVFIIGGQVGAGFGRCWRARQGVAANYNSTGNQGAYDTAQVPTIGCHAGGVLFFDGTLLTLGLFPWLFSDSDAKYITDLLTAGVV